MSAFRFKPMGMTLRHWSWLNLMFVVLICINLIISVYFHGFYSMEILIGSFALIFGFFHFLNQQHIEKARFFKELVTEFNRRYDEQNNNLLSILETSELLEQRQKQALIDYFNLCAEEYMFYELGYIYKRVWDAWYKGMKQFGQDKRVVELWQKEIQTDSYYGFEFPIENNI